MCWQINKWWMTLRSCWRSERRRKRRRRKRKEKRRRNDRIVKINFYKLSNLIIILNAFNTKIDSIINLLNPFTDILIQIVISRCRTFYLIIYHLNLLYNCMFKLSYFRRRELLQCCKFNIVIKKNFLFKLLYFWGKLHQCILNPFHFL